MHELSIAEALAGQVARHAPAGKRVRGVEIRAGALRAIDPEALRMCWDAVTHETALAGASLSVDVRPWSLACPSCGRQWESAVPFVSCTCGETAPRPSGGDELYLVALTVEDVDGADSEAAMAAPPAEAGAADGSLERPPAADGPHGAAARSLPPAAREVA